ncbi:M23 family metallopeptidase [Solirubrobacter sp. CPCC 204708]|uniref:M23 family metallopeptidase n=1 Tax=Solirubrobacter deserti TaxID=2282478 RepID=A0ABT4RKE5_9ACTN|nr:M23 family metallopeptidase [Solirubrobacter deserti]MBE2317295.1 M23 family metallopeptidase [Solirubrobacter deserti]MDA0139024.1 M23 family metallopeptidase [Solirubrobacter deserti]
MIVVLAAAIALLIAPAAHAQSGGTAAPTARGFTATPHVVTEGAAVTFAFNATPKALTRVDLIAPGKPAVRAKLGRVSGSGAVKATWTATLTPGRYTARLVVTVRNSKQYFRQTLTVAPKAPPTPPAALTTSVGSKIFPVQGPYTFGGEQSKFGVGRVGHTHQGQDLAAAEGTPVATPVAGTVQHVAYQASGAGYYVVIAGVDGRHYVFMHLQENSTVVAKDQLVTAGQRIANVGNTGGSSGPHLHFEIWVNGWRASAASAPVDPLPELQAWAASAG